MSILLKSAGIWSRLWGLWVYSILYQVSWEWIIGTGVWVRLLNYLGSLDKFLLYSRDEKKSEEKWSVTTRATSVTSVSDVLRICWEWSLSDDEMNREMAQGRDYRLVNRESEGERGESVVSEKSEKRAERSKSAVWWSWAAWPTSDIHPN